MRSKNGGLRRVCRALLAAAVMAVCLLTGCSGSAPVEENIYNDGVYEGRALGYNANITVMVTVEDDRITGVTVVSHADDEPYWSNAQRVIDDIVAAGTLEVDAVSGATYSSQGIIDAAGKALEKAVRQ